MTVTDIIALKAPFSGVVVKLAQDLLSPGYRIKAGQRLVLLERMKMQSWVEAPRDSLVNKVFVEAGDRVQSGQTLLELITLP